MSALNLIPLVRRMGPRDPHEAHRVASPLELFFDLVFVVAISSAAAQLHHGLSAAHYETILGFGLVFFAIWWAWMNYAWFASAYDCDDVVYRLLTFAIMAGSLLLAAGVPDLFDDGQSVAVVTGYAVMRLAMVALWLRVAKDDRPHRTTALTYAVGITVVQGLWIARLALDGAGVLYATFGLLVLAELTVPWLAEQRGGPTPFHPHHIAERYGLFTIIVLGEVILASVQAIQGVLAKPVTGTSATGHGPVTAAEAGGGGGLTPGLVLLAVGGLLIVFSLWWLYFKREHVDLIGQGRTMTWVFSYAHVCVFAAVAAVGAGLAAAVDVVEHAAIAGPRAIAFALAVPIAVYSMVLGSLHAAADHDPRTAVPAIGLSVVVLGIAALGLEMPLAVLLIGIAMAGAVAEHVLFARRRLDAAPDDGMPATSAG
ncbi:low temperature requirement protein A [Pedococcus sp. KACC 23699]|uniref:Low temperature requirement protein A n=1 Tax=Pedococcus sp. KACC 23699 TaxID=3149228 RepID=A0AAU7JYG2_9MICO